MYNVLIADDERIVREGIVNNINWVELGMQVYAQSSTGTSAQETARKASANNEKIDIALLDINMPGENGLEVAKTIKSIFPECQIVMITGYDEFEYAQSAIRTGVFDYVLKPITKLELCEILLRVKITLDSFAKEKIIAPKDKEILLKNTFSKLITTTNKQSALKYSKSLGIDESAGKYIVAVVDADNFAENNSFSGEGMSLFSFALLNISCEIIDQNTIAQCDPSGKTVIIFSSKQNTYSFLNESNKLVLQIQSTILSLMGVGVSAGLSNVVDCVSKISDAYKNASYALDFRFIKGEKAIINFDSLRINPNSNKFDTILDSFLSKINFASSENALQMIETLFCSMSECFNYTACKNAAVRTIVLIAKIFGASGVELEDLEPGIDIIGRVYSAKTLLELENWTKSLFIKYRNSIEENSSSSKIVSLQIKDYLSHNYKSNSLTLKQLCNDIHFSPSYVSLIFKNEIQKTFVEFLTNIRIEKAKELLQSSNQMTYKIAESVGFSSPHYFSLVFKKATGLSPKEFREQL